MAIMSILYLLIPLLSSLSASAQNIQACPANAKTFTGDDGRVWEHCPFADFQGTTTKLLPNVISAHACLQACSKAGSSTCTQAVWDSYGNYCHFKASGSMSGWAASRKSDTLRLVSSGSQPVAGLNACPTDPKFYEASSGAIFEICENTEYQADQHSINRALQSQDACIQWCADTNGCTLAIWDKNAKTCFSKNQNAKWVNTGSTAFNAIRMIAPPAPLPQPAGFTGCPSRVTRWTFDDGSVYEVCPNSDYQGGTYQLIDDVVTDWQCLRRCNVDPVCQLTVWDHQTNQCHLKSTSGMTWAGSNRYSTARLVLRGSRSNLPYTGTGRWTAPIPMPANPVAAWPVFGTNRVLGLASNGPDDFSGPSGKTQFSDWNFVTGETSRREVANTKHDMFCPGISSLADGRVVITGGNNAFKTSLYDPASNAFSPGPDMRIARGYQASGILSNGNVFTIGGSWNGPRGGKTGEIFNPFTNTWTLLKGCDPGPALTSESDPFRSDNHMWLFGWKQGSVFQAGPSRKQNWYDTSSSGRTIPAGTRDPNSDAMCASFAMFDAVNGSIWSGGGSPMYTDSNAIVNAHVTTIGEAYAHSSSQKVANMPRARAFSNAVVLPDGQIIVTGGMSYAKVFNDDSSHFIADLYDPAANTWATLAPAKIPRNYHSISLLLSDGTVLTGGGGLCYVAQQDCNRKIDHPSFEVFYPPYLFNADGTFATRPQILKWSSSSQGTSGNAKAADTLSVTVDSQLSDYKFSLLRVGTATHSVNTDQRRVPLTGTRSGSTWSLKLPTDNGILIAGNYYLFVTNGAGVPSHAEWVHVLL